MNVARKSAQGFDRPTLIWMFGGLLALGLAVSGVLWAAISANRDAIAELAKGVTRIEAILEERLPRDR